MNMFVPAPHPRRPMLPSRRSDGRNGPASRLQCSGASFPAPRQRALLQRPRRSAALPLPVAHVSAGPVPGGLDISSPRSLLARSRVAFRRGLRRRALHQSPLRVRARRQPRLRALIRLHQAGIAQLASRFPGATVLSAWPMTDELSSPELGCLRQPFDVFAIDDFSSAQIARAAAQADRFSAALVFSTKYDPPRPVLSLGSRTPPWTSSTSASTTIFPPRPSPPGLAARSPGVRKITVNGSG